MAQRFDEIADEELEELIRSLPRRMPSAALWARISAEAHAHKPRRHPQRRWAVAAAMAAVACVAAGAWFFTAKGTPPREGATREVRRAVPVVAKVPPAVTSVVVQTTEPRVGVKRPRPEHVQRAAHRVEAVWRMKREVAPPKARLVENKQPAGAVMQAEEAPRVESSSSAVPVGNVAEARAVEESTDSSYYIEVSQGGRSSVLQGSVTRDAVAGRTEIKLVYDGEVTRTAF